MPDFNKRPYSKLYDHEIEEVEKFYFREPNNESEEVDNSMRFVSENFNISESTASKIIDKYFFKKQKTNESSI